jgi:hypothetical protein
VFIRRHTLNGIRKIYNCCSYLENSLLFSNKEVLHRHYGQFNIRTLLRGRIFLHEWRIAPEKALSRIYHSVPQAPPDAIELDNLQWGAKLTGPVESAAVTPSEVETPVAPDDLEMSRPVTPNQESEGFEVIQSIMNPPMNKFRMLAVCTMSFCTGLNDSAPGALIPYIESYVKHFCIT